MSWFDGIWLLGALEGDPRERLEAFRRGFRPQPDGLDPQTIFFWATVACLAVVCVWLAQRMRERLTRRWQRNPWGLFHALCQAHGLDRRQTRLLRDLAICRSLEFPALLFVERRLFDAEGLSASLSQCGDQLREVQQALFANELPKPPAEGSAR